MCFTKQKEAFYIFVRPQNRVCEQRRRYHAVKTGYESNRKIKLGGGTLLEVAREIDHLQGSQMHKPNKRGVSMFRYGTKTEVLAKEAFYNFDMGPRQEVRTKKGVLMF